MIVEYSFDEGFKKLFKKLDRMPHAYELRQLDGIGEQLDLNKFSRNFFSKKGQTTADVSVDANSNVGKNTILHYQNELSKPIQRLWAYYDLWNYSKQLYNEKIAEEIIMKQLSKIIYINDLHNFTKPYCFNFSCMDIVCNGIPFAGITTSKSAKNCISFIEHVTSSLTYFCNQIAGATGLADFLICYAWYVEKLLDENKNSQKLAVWIVKQQLQGFIYQVNQPFKGSIESPFCNVSIYDDVFLDKFCNEYIFPDNKKVKKETVQWLQELFLDEINNALEKTIITFPVLSACFSVDNYNKIQDYKFLDMIVKKNLKFGSICCFSGKTSVLSSCCRLRSDNTKQFFTTMGAGSTKIGSVGVVTLNLPRLAYTSRNKDEFLNQLKINVKFVSRINHVKRMLLQKNIEKGYLPLYTLGYMSLKHQYSTCGINGLYEALEILGYNVLEENGQKFITEILQLINSVNAYQEQKYKTPHNLEQVPGEASSAKLADADKILGYNKKYTFYSNQFIPLTINADIFDRIKLQGQFDKYMTGGAICHLHFVDQIADYNFMKKLIIMAVENGVVYHAYNYNLQKCENNHITVGKNKKCSICGKDIANNYTRVVGFLTDVSNWVKQRREYDYPNRQQYEEKK
ncbi:MAG: anaerobic ribonucleoside-triphosphate reductase [Patescibacteria group bacterium]|jgi:ribonucleoside-triphosphate reductase